MVDVAGMLRLSRLGSTQHTDNCRVDPLMQVRTWAFSDIFIPLHVRIGSINSHYFHIIGDGKLNPIIGFFIPIIRIPIKGGMTIPNIVTFDHGTHGFDTIVFLGVIYSC